MRHVAMLIPTDSDSTPAIDEEKSQIEWDKLNTNYWFYGSGPVHSDISPNQIVVANHPDATNWDFFFTSNSWGIISEKLTEVVRPYCNGMFDFWPCTLNRVKYFIPRKIGEIDCLDKKLSQEVRYGENIGYSSFIFLEDKLPKSAMFTVPEEDQIFATADVARHILTEKLNGIEIYNAAGSQKTHENIDWDPSW
ncbi:hypothetical protein [uncultured Gimesia sp.]|uniref:hypothetical protein n=1 Tax=uncultured Gimesia sp. TaxID=1678688 RepID=UPI00262B690C|nr:hypothetical protein [uncultured Gimesia sp.]